MSQMTNHFVSTTSDHDAEPMHPMHYGDAAPTERGTDDYSKDEQDAAWTRTKSGYFTDSL